MSGSEGQMRREIEAERYAHDQRVRRAAVLGLIALAVGLGIFLAGVGRSWS